MTELRFFDRLFSYFNLKKNTDIMVQPPTSQNCHHNKITNITLSLTSMWLTYILWPKIERLIPTIHTPLSIYFKNFNSRCYKKQFDENNSLIDLYHEFPLIIKIVSKYMVPKIILEYSSLNPLKASNLRELSLRYSIIIDYDS